MFTFKQLKAEKVNEESIRNHIKLVLTDAYAIFYSKFDLNVDTSAVKSEAPDQHQTLIAFPAPYRLVKALHEGAVSAALLLIDSKLAGFSNVSLYQVRTENRCDLCVH